MSKKKKSFALSWGRKMFFGLGWGFTSLVALNYFQSMIFPHSFVELVYFITTFIGHYGLLLSLLYFLVYCPVILIFPSYYVSRIWSLTLILSVNLFIFLDSYLFTKYRYHLNSFLGKLLLDERAPTYFEITPLKMGLASIVLLIAFFVLWLRGERIWRSMQARFSNPVKNWYLVLILICVVSSNLIHMFSEANGSQNITRLSNLFPLHYPWTGKQVLKEQGMLSENAPKNYGYKDLYYPASSLKCQMKTPDNILLIVLDNWSASDSLDLAPNLNHYKTHALFLNNHYTAGMNEQEGYFSILYSIPPVYLSSALNESKPSVLISQMKKSNIDMAFFKDGNQTPVKDFLIEESENPLDNLESHLAERDDLAKINPFMTQVYLSGGTLTEKDAKIKLVMDLFFKHKLLKNTIVIITGATGNQNDFRTPMLLIWPGQESGVIEKATSHYDILPTVMAQNWGCKNPTTDYSFGHNIFSKTLTENLPVGTYKTLKVLDLKNNTIVSVDKFNGLKSENETDVSALLKTLEKLTLFYHRR